MQIMAGNLVVFFWTVLTIECQKWYTATVMDNGKFKPNFIKEGLKDSGTSHLHQLWSSDTNKSRIEFEATTPSPSAMMIPRPFLNVVSTNPNHDDKNRSLYRMIAQELIWQNHTLTNVNVIKRTQPKRKIVRRCPTVHPKQKKQLHSHRKSKFLEVFQVVEFQHVPCVSSSGLEGTCLHEYECTASARIAMGECADGYGTCCVAQISCGKQASSSTVWFTNPGFPAPSTERLSCAVTIDKTSPDIRQMRLDFQSFELLQPTSGTCEQDQFVVSGHNTNDVIPILCGVNNGQHLYLEVGDVDGPVYLSVQTVTEDSRLFAIKVTQLTAADNMAAPTGCLQYYRGPHGVLESFNYQDMSTISIARVPSYLNNVNYAMCIERATESCSVTYTNTGDMDIANYDTDGLPLIPAGQAGVEIFNCPSDWLLVAAARLCGDRLNDGSVFQDFSVDAPVTDSSAGPIVVWFRSDGAYVGRGFRLEYQQNPCSSPA